MGTPLYEFISVSSLSVFYITTMNMDARFKRSMSLDPGPLTKDPSTGEPGQISPKTRVTCLQKSVSYEEPCISKKVRKIA